ncbi:hypothetical protein P0J00_003458 [Vibrio vulnificus]|nr:hypothetical protein [Vibrio vulnificus]EKO5193458.1 hypothetical protein [Vibrio vulnificus]
MNDNELLDVLYKNTLTLEELTLADADALDTMQDKPEQLFELLAENELLDELLSAHGYKKLNASDLLTTFFYVIDSWFGEQPIDFKQPLVTPLFDFLLVRRQLLEVIQQFK